MKPKFSLDLLCPTCKNKNVPIIYDRKTNSWYHTCGWSEEAERAVA